MARALAVSALLAASACYGPSFTPCELRCAAGGACPNGLRCNTQGMCAMPGDNTCSGPPIDAPRDANGDALIDSLFDAPPCTWRPSNVDACALGITSFSGQRTLGSVTIDTDVPRISPTQVPAFDLRHVMGTGGQPLTVLLVHDLGVNGPIIVQGNRPLVIVANGSVALLDSSSIAVPPNDASCLAISGGQGMIGGNATGASPTAGGGGGGGYGIRGGAGGLAPQAAGGSGGLSFGNANLIPLRGGCRGGMGGNGNLGGAGPPGLGGAAIQISARIGIVLNGFITVPGGPGTSGSSGTGAGGGGGGAGGGILIESPSTTLLSRGALCANGGGGGAGAGSGGGSGMVPIPAGEGTCSATQPAMGANQFAVGGGGQGAAGVSAAGNASAGDSFVAGGGGGGAVGRIQINGTLVNTMGGFTTPTASTGPAPTP